MKFTKYTTAILVGLLLLAAGGLVSGLYAGLLRLGFSAPVTAYPVSPVAHGPLMINGFLGTLIGVERAAALDKKWAYAAPVFIALSTLLMLTGYQQPGRWLMMLGSIGLTGVMIYLYYLQPKIYHLIMAAGAASLAVGNTAFLFHYPVYVFVAWWAAFPMLTIFGERLELNRIMRPPEKARKLFGLLIFLWILALVTTHVDRDAGWRLASLLLMVIAAWLIRYDVARRTIKAAGWTRYSAISLLTGYGWLIAGGLFGIWRGFPTAGPIYDALLHMIFVGFVFSMIFAHASVIIPSLSGKLVAYHNYFYLPLILLHLFLVFRVMGDLAWWPAVRKAGSYGNIVAILLFLGGIAVRLITTTAASRRETAARVLETVNNP
ncbi:hypothetical protein SAMN06265218_103207 [Fodinibius sediminis]|uniref:NnrS protein n=2 Tax=Fodinibius sediminis TaxID=1214077 RepID=A0A521BL65_9BACT|nr:hypothetical protein SAMN06265218_103207 [Fodinibius sediminis]